jgi:hypothetical protein
MGRKVARTRATLSLFVISRDRLSAGWPRLEQCLLSATSDDQV